MKSSKCSFYLLTVLILSINLVVTGCSKEEAKALKDTAKLFGDESIAAIDATETMFLKEVQEPDKSANEKKMFFIRAVLRKDLSDQELVMFINQILNPPQPSNLALGRVKSYLDSLREEYGTLASVYDDLERGHILANEAVQKSKIPLEKLTVQMAYLAVCIDKYPANLIKDKSVILSEVISLRRAYFASSDSLVKKDIENRIYEQFLLWQKTEEAQQELTQTILKHATKSAMLGRELKEKIENYGDINLENLNSLLINVLDIVSNVNGQNYSSLKKQANQVWETIKNDEDFRGSAEFILGQFNSNSASKNSNEAAFSVDGCSAIMTTRAPVTEFP